MATRIITGTILNAAGNPIVGAPVSFVMQDRTYTVGPDETYVASAVSTTTDVNGDFSVTVTAGLPTLWTVKMPGNDNFVISIPEGDATTVEALRAAYNGGGPAIIRGTRPYQRVYNVRDYGAEGDGAADDTTALLAAQAAAVAAGGGVVYVPEGTYLTSTSLLDGVSDVAFVGDGRGLSIIKVKSAANTNAFNITGSRCAVRHLKVDGNRANQTTGGHGIRISGVDHILDDLTVQDAWGYGLGVGQATASTVQHCHFSNIHVINPGSDGIDFKNRANTNEANTLTNIVIDGFDARLTGGEAGIDCRGPVQLTNIEVRGVSVAGSGIRFRQYDSGTSTEGGRYSSLTNALIVGDDSTLVYGLSIHAEDVSVSNVTIVDAWRGLLVDTTAERAAVSNTTVINAVDRGFYVASDLQTTLTNCRTIDTPVGFRIDGDDVAAVNCSVLDSATQAFYLLGNRTILTNAKADGTGTGIDIDAAATDTQLLGGDLSLTTGTKLNDGGTGTIVRMVSGVIEKGWTGQGLAYANTSVPAGNTVAATTTETAFASTYTLPANALLVGSVLKITAKGICTTSATPPNLTTAVKLGSTTLVSNLQALDASQTNREWGINLLVVVTALGASGSVEVQGDLWRNSSSTARKFLTIPSTAAVTLDTTAANTLQITVGWASADASTSFSLRQLVVEVLNP